MEKTDQSKIIQLLNELAAAKKADREAYAAECAAKEAADIARKKEQIRPLFDVYETLKAAGHGDSVMTEPRVCTHNPTYFQVISRYGSPDMDYLQLIPRGEGRWELQNGYHRSVSVFDSMTEVVAWVLDHIAEGLSHRK